MAFPEMKTEARSSKLGFGMALTSCAKRDAETLARFHHQNYPHIGWSRDYLLHQYFKNPAGPAKNWMIKTEDAIIANCTAIPHILSSPRQNHIAWRMQDLLTRSDFRGRGIFYTFSTAIKNFFNEESLRIGFAFPNDKSYRGFITTGWRALFRIPLWILGSFEADPKPAVLQCDAIKHFDSNASAVWESYRKWSGMKYGLERSQAYLEWRYRKNPRVSYAPFRIRSGKRELIFVMKVYQGSESQKVAHICDFFQSHEDPELTLSGIREARNYAAAQACGTLSCWSSQGSWFSKVLEEEGFELQEKLDRWFVVYIPKNKKMPKSFFEEKFWHLSMGDTDVV